MHCGHTLIETGKNTTLKWCTPIYYNFFYIKQDLYDSTEELLITDEYKVSLPIDVADEISIRIDDDIEEGYEYLIIWMSNTWTDPIRAQVSLTETASNSISFPL